jgi:hypothetical protein
MLDNVNKFLRTIILAGLLALAGWWTLFVRAKLGDGERELAERDRRIEQQVALIAEKDGRIETQERELAEQAKKISLLELSMQFLKVDHRVARIDVLSQEAVEGEPERVRTRVRFVELDRSGEPLGEGREAEVEGRTVYVETLVIKFDDAAVEAGDALRGTSICLFRRLFGEAQRPSEGVPLDDAGVQPLAYGGDETPDPLYRELWGEFWELANDPARARERGVRAIHGEAPFIEARPGKSYRVELRASGGLSIRAEE